MDGRETLKDATALSCVVSVGAAKLLIDAETRIDLIEGCRMSSLVKAAIQRYIPVFEYLLAQGTDATMNISIEGKFGTILALISEKLEF